MTKLKYLSTVAANGNHSFSTSTLGARLRHSRLVCGYTLKQLAARAGCSESMISKLEHNVASPSLATLHRLAAALNTNVSQLTAGQDQEMQSPVLPAGERLRVRFAAGKKNNGIEWEKLTLSIKGGLLQGYIHILAPGSAGNGQLVHGGEEMGYVLQGCLELSVDDSVFLLKAGDAFHFTSDRRHRYKNPGTEEAHIIWINTPPTF